jgi:hypothetical protein
MMDQQTLTANRILPKRATKQVTKVKSATQLALITLTRNEVVVRTMKKILVAIGLLVFSTTLLAWEVTSSYGHKVLLSQGYTDNVNVSMLWGCEYRVSAGRLRFDMSGMLETNRPYSRARMEVSVDGYKIGYDIRRDVIDFIDVYPGDAGVNRLSNGKSLVLSSSGVYGDYRSSYYLSGSADGIVKAIALCQREVADARAIRATKEKEEMVFGILLLIGLLIALMALWKGVKKISKIAKTKAAHAKRAMNSGIEEARANKVRSKIDDAFIDEVVREAVRQAMRKGQSPDDIEVCSACAGRGCSKCNDKGWLLGGKPFEE